MCLRVSILVFLFLIALLGACDTSVREPLPILEASSLNILTNANPEQSLTLTNRGEVDLTWRIDASNVGKTSISDWFSVSERIGSLASEENAILQMNLKEDLSQGDYSDELIIKYADKELIIDVVALVSEFEAKLTVSSNELELSRIRPKATFSVSNLGDSDSELEWQIADLPRYLTASPSSGTLGGKASQVVRIILAPDSDPQTSILLRVNSANGSAVIAIAFKRGSGLEACGTYPTSEDSQTIQASGALNRPKGPSDVLVKLNSTLSTQDEGLGSLAVQKRTMTLAVDYGSDVLRALNRLLSCGLA